MTFLSEPPSGLPFDVNHEWRQRAPKGCRNPKKLRVEYWKKYNHVEIPLRSRQDWYKVALKVAEEASTPEELERGFEAEYYNDLRKQLELARKICKKGRDGDSYNLQRATAEILNEKALASLLQLCTCLLYGWAEPDRSKKDMAEEEEAYIDRALKDPSLIFPSQTQHISLTKDGEDEDTSDNAIDSEPDSDWDEFGPYEAPLMRNYCFDFIGQLEGPQPAYSTDAAAEKNPHAEPALNAGTVGAHEHAKRDTARSVAESAQPLARPASPSKQEPSSICNQSMTNRAAPPSPPSTASPRSDSTAGAGCCSGDDESQSRQQPTSPASVPEAAATKKPKCGEPVANANGKRSDYTKSDSSPTHAVKSTGRKRSRSESPFDADIEEEERFSKRRSKFRK
ncbi:hypothetical protein HC256_001462 [Beauveria bassiana]|nr:hypothetical protein HC256_001462 [Beauveria bassiana]